MNKKDKTPSMRNFPGHSVRAEVLRAEYHDLPLWPHLAWAALWAALPLASFLLHCLSGIFNSIFYAVYYISSSIT